MTKIQTTPQSQERDPLVDIIGWCEDQMLYQENMGDKPLLLPIYGAMLDIIQRRSQQKPQKKPPARRRARKAVHVSL